MEGDVVAVKLPVGLSGGEPVRSDHGGQIGDMPGRERFHIFLFLYLLNRE
jgi:hypothetical protein